MNVFWGYTGISLSVCSCVKLCVQNTCNIASQTPPIGLLQLYLPFPKQALVFMSLQYRSFENTAGKKEIACNKQFLCFPQFFLPV